MNPLYPSVAARAHHRCEYCRAPEAAFNFPLEVDHVIPTARGGGDEDKNLALACRSCNAFKSDAAFADDPETALFNPRKDRWEEHFAITDNHTILGTTPSGRATVTQLRMNAARQVAARALWRLLGLYP